MKKGNQFFRILGQGIALSIFLIPVAIILYFSVPGKGSSCDAEGIFWLFLILLIAIFGFGLLVNSYLQYKNGVWKNYRIIVASGVVLCVFLIFTLNPILFAIQYGKIKYELKENNSHFSPTIHLNLYQNGKFYAYTYDASCEEENIGAYTLQDNKLELKFKNEKSKYLGSYYTIQDSLFTCNDCSYEYHLKLKE